MTKTHEQFVKEVYLLVEDEYSVLSAYENSIKKIKIKHNVCGVVYKVTPDNFLHNHRCPTCSRLGKRLKEASVFIEEVCNLAGKEYSVLEDYHGANKKIKMCHNLCGYIYLTSPHNFLTGARCPKCAGKGKDTDRFKEEVFKISGNEYSVVGEYSGAKNKIEMRHNVCGNFYFVQPSNFLSGYGCPKCSSSQIESKLATQLKKYFGKKYGALEEYIIPDLKNKYRYDIYIPNTKIFVEIHGSQHYVESSGMYFGKLKTIKDRDKVKKKYAKQRGTYIEIDTRKFTLEQAIIYIEEKIQIQENNNEQ